MSRVRRTRAEIKAGLSVEDKKAGLTLKEFKAARRKEKAKQKETKVALRTRRTREEIAAGLTLEAKQEGVTLAQYIHAKEKQDSKKLVETKAIADTRTAEEKHAELRAWLQKPVKTKAPKGPKRTAKPYELDRTTTAKDGTVTHFKSRDVEVEIEVQVPVIKEVRVLFGDEGSPLTVAEILNDAMGRISYDWIVILVDKSFKSSTVAKLGKEGWRHMYTHSPKHVKVSWKDKPDELHFCRPKRDKDGRKPKRAGTPKNRASNSAKNAKRPKDSS